MNATAPLPRNDSRDRRTIAQRTPQIPVTALVRLAGETRAEAVQIQVGIGGWSYDVENAVARTLDVDASEITVVSVQGGHR